MEDRTTLGQTTLQISPLGLGTWQWGDRVMWSYSKTHTDSDLHDAFQAGARPLGISIIAWWLVGSTVLTVAVALFGIPTMLLGSVLTGAWATGVYVLFAAAELYLGIGLLRLRDRARWGSIAFFGFMLVNAVVFWLLPGSAERIQTFMREISPAMETPPAAIDFSWHGLLPSILGLALFVGLPIWFLIRCRPSFRS